MLVGGKNSGEEGRAYRRAKNVKTLDQGSLKRHWLLPMPTEPKPSSRVEEGHSWQAPTEILYLMQIHIRTSRKKFRAPKQFNRILK